MMRGEMNFIMKGQRGTVVACYRDLCGMGHKGAEVGSACTKKAKVGRVH